VKSTIRRAPENPAFRLVELEDLVAGREIFMIDGSSGNYGFEHPISKITLDQIPVSDRGRGHYVRYHCTHAPSWDGQCFVPLDDFLGKLTASVPRDATHYWLPIGD